MQGAMVANPLLIKLYSGPGAIWWWGGGFVGLFLLLLLASHYARPGSRYYWNVNKRLFWVAWVLGLLSLLIHELPVVKWLMPYTQRWYR